MNCTCTDHKVRCSNVRCPDISRHNCSRPIALPGDCCPSFCPGECVMHDNNWAKLILVSDVLFFVHYISNSLKLLLTEANFAILVCGYTEGLLSLLFYVLLCASWHTLYILLVFLQTACTKVWSISIVIAGDLPTALVTSAYATTE